MPRTPDGVLRVTRAMVSDFEELIAEVTERVWREVPAYGQILVEQTELREQVSDSVLNVLVCVMEDRSPHPAELERAATNGERRALQGVSQAAVIRSYRAAERTLVSAFQARCGRMHLGVTDVLAGQRLITQILDQLEQAMLTTYLAMQQRIATRSVLTEPDLMNRLASGEPIDPEELSGLVRTLGVDIGRSPVVGVAACLVEDHTSDDLATLRHHLVARLAARTRQTPLSGAVRDDDTGLVVLAVPWDRTLPELAEALDAVLDRRRLAAPAMVAVGDPRDGLADVGSSCRQAMAGLRVARLRGAVRRATLHRDVLLEVLVLSQPGVVADIQERYLRPLAAHEHLVDTLRCHLETDLSIPETARRLVVHPNTVAYRLRRVEELTGLDLRRVRDVVHTMLAVEGLALREPAVEPTPGTPEQQHGAAARPGDLAHPSSPAR